MGLDSNSINDNQLRGVDMGIAFELLKLFPNEPPSKEFMEKLAELNRLSGNKILGPIGTENLFSNPEGE